MDKAATPVCLPSDHGSPPDALPQAEVWGNQGDFASLYEQHYPRVFNYILRTVADWQTAEDITSEAFLRALRQFADYRSDRGPFAAWVYRIATNAMRDNYRRNKRQVFLPDGDDALDLLLTRRHPQRSAADQLADAETRRELYRQVLALPLAYREVIVLFYFEERSIREIAGILGALAPTVRWRLHQARRRLARQMNGKEAAQ